MLEKIQEGGQSLVIKIILGLIIISFALAGIGSYLVSPGSGYAAKVNGETISKSEFEQAYQNERSQMENRYGKAFSQLASNPEYMAQVKRSVLVRLVNQKLIEQQSKAMGLAVSDDQVKQAILKMGAFQKDGSFNNTLFKQRLANAGLTPLRFSQLIRKDLINQQLQSSLFGSEFSLPNEAQRIARLQTQTRSFRYVELSTAAFKPEIRVTQKQLKDYYDTHQNEFRSPEMVNIHYILVDAKQLAQQIKVSDAKARTYLDNHASQYQQPEQRKVAHILIKFGKDPKKALQRADLIEKQLKKGANFTKLAKADSQDEFTAKKGGVLNWFQKGVMPPAFDKAAFGLKKVGDISSVVKTKYGYHIIELLGVRPAQMPPFKSLKAKLVQQVQQSEAMTKFYDLSQKLSNLSFEMPNSLKDVAKQMGVKVLSATNVSREGLPSDIQSQQVIKHIFSSTAITQQQNSNVINLSPEKALVVRVVGHHPSKVKPLKVVETQAHDALVIQKALKASNAYAKKLVASVNDMKQFNQLIADKGLKIQKINDATRFDRSFDPHVLQQVFSMAHPKADKPLFKQFSSLSGAPYVVELTHVNQPKPKEKLIEEINHQLVGQNANEDYRLLLNYLKSKADISYHG